MKPVLILLPGLSGTSKLMKWIVPYLEDCFSLRLVDLPESQNAGDQNYETLASYVYETYLSKEKNGCWVLGESFSGPIAIKLAKQYPKSIAGIILAATFASTPNRFVRYFQKLLLPFLLPILSCRFTRQWGGLLFLCAWQAFQLSANMRNIILQELGCTPTKTIKERLKTVMTCDVRSCLPLAQPVLYLKAKHDWLVHKQASEILQSLQPSIQIHSFDSPHLLLQFQPQEAAQAIQVFIIQNSANKSSVI